MADIVAEIKKLLKEDKLVIGKDETLKGLRTGKFVKVFLSANCPAVLKEDIEHYASLAGVEVVDTGLQNVELGDICKKPFSIAAIGLLK
ncbi:ribosomal L7Ae/L30e/S12e/Gadd45 family protein [Candidatus Woesearchaeota archaeon]|nr:ribosomal L7Ae/L30e/S12e/Gadd45 family protein [Candidatus Woesearchaeota archaeon]